MTTTSHTITALFAATALAAAAANNAQATEAAPLEPRTAPACRDDARPLSGPPHDQGETNVRVLAGDPRRLAATWTAGFGNASEGDQSEWNGQAVFARRSASGAWSQQVLFGTPAKPADHPWLDSYQDGTTYVSYRKDTGITGGPVYLHKVPLDGPVGAGQSSQMLLSHPSIAADQLTKDRLYLAGMSVTLKTLDRGRFGVSDNGGGSWQTKINFPTPIRTSYPPGAKFMGQFGEVVATGGGTVLVAWAEVTHPWNLDPPRIVIRAARFDRATGDFDPESVTNVAEMDANDIYLPYGANPYPALAVVRNGEHAGEYAYLVWAHWTDYATRATDIMLSRSTDGGRSWSAPRRVNDDLDQENGQVFPSVSATDRGSAVVSWFDSRNDPAYHGELHGFQAEISVDGSVGSNTQVTDCAAYADADPAGVSALGDYFNMDASGPGGPVWLFSSIRKPEGDSDADVYLLEPDSDGR